MIYYWNSALQLDCSISAPVFPWSVNFCLKSHGNAKNKLNEYLVALIFQIYKLVFPWKHVAPVKANMTDGQTVDAQYDPYVALCFTVTKINYIMYIVLPIAF